MAVTYYVCPVELLYAVGAGRFSLTDPGDARATRGARALIYGEWDQARGTRCTVVKGSGLNGVGKSWGVARVEDTDPASGLIDTSALDADAACVRFPVSADLLDREFQSFTPTIQETIVNRFEAIRVPTEWMTPTTTIRQIIGHVLRVLFCAQQLGADYPELDLSATWNTLSTAQRNRIVAWAQSRGVTTTGLTGGTTLRVIIGRLVTADFGPIVFGGETF